VKIFIIFASYKFCLLRMIEDFRLRVFLTVASAGNFTRAAGILGISQPAVSQNIAELERLLAVPLFARGRGQISLTPEGAVFKDYAERILGLYKAAGGLFGSAGSLSSNKPIIIEASEFAATWLLPVGVSRAITLSSANVIIRTYDESPDIKVTVSPRNPSAGTSDIVGVLPACAVSYGPAGDRIAVWSPYEPLLSPTEASKVQFVSDSVQSIINIAGRIPGLVGIIPHPASTDTGLTVQPEPLPHLQFDIRLKASPDCPSAIVSILRDTLSNRS
jgi:molybdenum-dependent DNA-binding transcriptional regulator ModE